MPDYIIKSPQGQSFRVTAPDGATQDQVLSYAQQHFSSNPEVAAAELKKSNPSEYDPTSKEYQAKYGPTGSVGQNLLAGAGKAFVDLGRGAGQLMGLESRGDIQEARRLDQPLMATTAGKVGNVAGNVAATLPALAIPGANTVAGASAVGAALGLLQPSTSTRETLTNVGLGGATGAGGQWLGNKISPIVANRIAARQLAAQSEASLNSARDTVLAQSRQAGYVVPPTAVNPNLTTTALESVSGKAATRQAAEDINAKVSNRLIGKDLGLAPDQPITRDALEGVRKAAGKVYGQVGQAGSIPTDPAFHSDLAALTQVGSDLEKAAPGIGAQASEKVNQLASSLAQPSFDAKDALGLFKLLNSRAKESFKSAFAIGNPEMLELARAQRAGADAVGDLIDRHLTTSGNQALSQAWKDARITIAKSYMAEGALKGNNIDALRLAAQMRRGAYLSGGFKQVAEFGDMFGEAARVPKSGAGVSKLAAVAFGGGALETLAHGHPYAAAAVAAGAAVPYGMRRGILSAPGQRLLATPRYTPNLLGTAALTGVGGLGRYGTLPAYMAAQPLVKFPQ